MKNLRKKLPPQRWKVVCFIGFGLALALLLVALLLESTVENSSVSTVLAIGGLVVFALTFASGLVFWRCPTCDRPLPLHGMPGMEYCPYCSYELEVNEDHDFR